MVQRAGRIQDAVSTCIGFVPFPVQAYPERGKTSAVTKGFPSSVAKIGIYLIIANFKVIFFKKNIKKVINH